MFFGLPVEKLSRPTTLWPSLSSCSVRCEPMNPAAPVTSQVRGLPFSFSSTRLMRPSGSSYVCMFGAPWFQFDKQVLVAVHHGLLGELRLHRLAGFRAHAAAHRGVAQDRQALDQRAGVADRI